MTDVIFRDLSGMAEFRAAEDLQRTVWGAGDMPDPADLMMVIQAEGGLVGGAFVDGRLVGYVFGFPTRNPQVQHSHRLAVLPQARGLHPGLRLKLYQRDWALRHGITHIRWTFDPLRQLNAALNIHRLGATANTYLPDYYGEMAGINGGLASDRLLVDWDLADPLVTSLAEGNRRQPGQGVPLPLTLPADLETLTRDAPDHAQTLRLELRAALQQAFAKGRRIVDFDRSLSQYRLQG